MTVIKGAPKRAPSHATLLRAVKTAMHKVPALVADGRPSTMREISRRLAADGMSDVEPLRRLSHAQLQALHAEAVKDLYATGKDAAPAAGGHTLVSGGSFAGLVSAATLAKGGRSVTVVEQRPVRSRDIRFTLRQGTLDTLKSIDPELTRRVLNVATPLKPGDLHSVTLPDGVDVPYETKVREPDGRYAPQSGKALMSTSSTHVVVARELETVIERYLTETYASKVNFVEGKLVPSKQPDGSVSWLIEKSKGSEKVVEPVPGPKPEFVLVAEGSSSSTREALGIETAEITPKQHWIAGVLREPDQLLPQGAGSVRSVYWERPLESPSAKKPALAATRAVAISDGLDGTWLLAEQAPFTSVAAGPDTQAAVNEHYFQMASLVTKRPVEHLKETGADGPIRRPGGAPTPFTLQGRASREAARVLPDGTIVGFIGDAVLTNAFQAGGGMNTAVTEVRSVMTLSSDLQSGVSPQKAASRFQDAVFEAGNAWAVAGIPYFYLNNTPGHTKRMQEAMTKAINAWREKGGASPAERMATALKIGSLATEPIGMRRPKVETPQAEK